MDTSRSQPVDSQPLNQSEPPPKPGLSTVQTLTGIFFEPSRVFESFRERPRFVIAAVITMAVTLCFIGLFIQRVGYENVVRARLEASKFAAQLEPAQKEEIVRQQSSPLNRVFGYVLPLVAIALFIAVGAGLYYLGTRAMDRQIGYKQALAVWTYSGLPPMLLLMIANVILVFVQSPEDIDVARSAEGLVHANPGFLVDSVAHPLLATAAGALDLFAFYGLFLAALGLSRVARLSTGASWLLVLSVWLSSVAVRLIWASISGTT